MQTSSPPSDPSGQAEVVSTGPETNPFRQVEAVSMRATGTGQACDYLTECGRELTISAMLFLLLLPTPTPAVPPCTRLWSADTPHQRLEPGQLVLMLQLLHFCYRKKTSACLTQSRKIGTLAASDLLSWFLPTHIARVQSIEADPQSPLVSTTQNHPRD